MPQLKSFTEAQRREGTLNRLPPYLAVVEVHRIVGSVSQTKVDTLTSAFLLRKDGANAPRYRSVLAAMCTDVPLPPIEVYALRDVYYVVDGHHRVAAARALGYPYFDALVHEFVLPATSAENRLHNERRHFERLTGLDDIVVTEPGQYPKLLRQIREHGSFSAGVAAGSASRKPHRNGANTSMRRSRSGWPRAASRTTSRGVRWPTCTDTCATTSGSRARTGAWTSASLRRWPTSTASTHRPRALARPYPARCTR